MRAILVTIVALWAQTALAVGVDSVVLDDPALEARAQTIMQELRCLVCQNQAIVDSNAPLAADLRQIVRERVALGEDAPAIKAYLVERYGDWVLLRPPVKRTTYLLWFAPIAVFLAAVAIVVVMRRNRPVLELTPSDVREADKLIEDGL
ncbi:MAG: cytochrome c-type biogenesis protein [Pseudomonadota bacterium]